MAKREFFFRKRAGKSSGSSVDQQMNLIRQREERKNKPKKKNKDRKRVPRRRGKEIT